MTKIYKKSKDKELNAITARQKTEKSVWKYEVKSKERNAIK
jgi:hypothetical protein